MFRDYDKAAVKNAFEKLNIGYTGGNSESAVTENLELPETIDGIAVTWKSDKQETVKNDGTVIRPTDADIQVTLTAKLIYNSQSIKKDIPITVKRLTRLEHSFMNGDGHFISDVTDFTGNEITMINEFKDSGTGEIEKHGARFSYTDLDVPNKRFKAQKTYMLSNNGTWVAIGSAEHRQALEVQQKKMPPYRGMTALVKQPIISLRDAASLFYRVPLSMSEQELFDMIHWDSPLSVSSYTAFKKLSAAEQTGVLKKWIDDQRKELAASQALSETASWEDLIQKAVDDRFNDEVQKAVPQIYRYTIHNNGSYYWFDARTLYEKGKKWFEHDHYSVNIDDKKIWFDNHGLTFSYDNNIYSGTLNSDGTQFTGKEYSSGETITVSITDNQDGTITIQVNGHTHTLHFSGNTVSVSW